MSRVTCQDCAFGDFSDQGPGLCRFNPPTPFVIVLPVRTVAGDSVQPTPITSLPSVRPQDWCGKAERKASPLKLA